MEVQLYMYLYYTVVLVPGNPLHNYHGNHDYLCQYTSMRLNCVVSSPAIWWHSVELSVQPSDVTCHLMAVHGTPMWQSRRTEIAKVCTRYVTVMSSVFMHAVY